MGYSKEVWGEWVTGMFAFVRQAAVGWLRGKGAVACK